MRTGLDTIATRLIPALLTAAGVLLLGVGLLSYSDPVAALDPSPSPVAVASPRPSATPSPSPAASASLAPSASPSTEVAAVATRVVVPALKIDLPIVRPEADEYPLCNVAMYLRELHQPGEAGATYLYAHAREGMFLPLLTESRRNAGRRMLGMLVQVYTDDDRVHLYEITDVRPVVGFATALDDPFAATTDQLWLQTSIGPAGTKEKLQVVATPLSVAPADHDEAHPVARPVVCG